MQSIRSQQLQLIQARKRRRKMPEKRSRSFVWRNWIHVIIEFTRSTMHPYCIGGFDKIIPTWNGTTHNKRFLHVERKANCPFASLKRQSDEATRFRWYLCASLVKSCHIGKPTGYKFSYIFLFLFHNSKYQPGNLML